MMCDNNMCTRDYEWIKMIMKTSICVNSKGNELISWCSFNVQSCFFLSNHRRFICYCHWCSLHHIGASWVSNDNVHQSTKAISNNIGLSDDTHILDDQFAWWPPCKPRLVIFCTWSMTIGETHNQFASGHKLRIIHAFNGYHV